MFVLYVLLSRNFNDGICVYAGLSRQLKLLHSNNNFFKNNLTLIIATSDTDLPFAREFPFLLFLSITISFLGRVHPRIK